MASTNITILPREVLLTKSPNHVKYILRKARKVLGTLESRVNGEDWGPLGGESPSAFVERRDQVRAYKNLLVEVLEEISS